MLYFVLQGSGSDSDKETNNSGAKKRRQGNKERDGSKKQKLDGASSSADTSGAEPQHIPDRLNAILAKNLFATLVR